MMLDGAPSSHSEADPNAREKLYEEVYGFDDSPSKHPVKMPD